MKERRKSRYVNIEELSKYLTISVNTLYGWINQRKIPYYKFGKSVRFKIQEIDEWVADSRISPFNI